MEENIIAEPKPPSQGKCKAFYLRYTEYETSYRVAFNKIYKKTTSQIYFDDYDLYKNGALSPSSGIWAMNYKQKITLALTNNQEVASHVNDTVLSDGKHWDWTVSYEDKVNPECEIPCSIKPSIQELLQQTGKKKFAIAKPKGASAHQLYLFNTDLTDIVYNPPQVAKGKITALRKVPMYKVVDCKWQPVGNADLRFSDCSDDMCEDVNGILTNGIDSIIKSKIGTIVKGHENAFITAKFPACCMKEQDSPLAGEIEDILGQTGKTFYLLGFPKGEDLPKLYLFNLGQVGGANLKYTHIKDAIVYKHQNCKWVKESDKSDIKFSSLKGDVDTNFYLLTQDKLEQPSPITKITHRQANEYLLKHIPKCNVPRPEGGGNPNDNLKPDFGGGSGGGGGNGSIGGGGFFPDVNRPLPNPEVPPCGNIEGGSQVPVSEIILLSVPELTPSYADTYDFTSPKAQETFFRNKPSASLYKYSYLRKDNAIQIGTHVDGIKCYNYLMYKNKVGKWYYCFIMDKQYINERTTRIIIATDVIQTYLFDYVVAPSYVERCHVPRWLSDGRTPTDEFEPEGLEFGEPIQDSYTDLTYQFSDTYIAVCANPLGEIPSRSALKKTEEEKPKGVEENGDI